MNGLKLVWIISRHYKVEGKMENLITTISNEIANKVENQIKIDALFRPKEGNYETQLDESVKIIKLAHKCLMDWKTHYANTRKQLEEDPDRWDFHVKAISERITHMILILDNMEKIADTLKKFLVFLGPDLKAVTEDTNNIDNLIKEVKGLVSPFIDNFPYNVIDICLLSLF